MPKTRKAKRAPVAKPPARYSVLHRALLALAATKEGFEGLTAALVAAASGGAINLMSSGDQAGVDAIEDTTGRTIRRAVQSKKYGASASLDFTHLRGEMDRAVEEFAGLDLWVLATTKPVHGKEAGALRRHGETMGLGVAVVDWRTSGGALPSLGVLCAAYPAVAADYITDPAKADLAAIAADPGFTAAREHVHATLNDATLGYAQTKALADRRLERIFHDKAEARRVAGASAALLVEGPPVPRPGPAAQVRKWVAGKALIGAMIGEEGAGKTWAALTSLRELGAADEQLMPLIVGSASAGRFADGLEAVVAELSDLGQREGLKLINPQNYWRRKLEIWSQARGTAAAPSIVVVADGLDEALAVDWDHWLAPLLEARWSGMFRVLLTCRPDEWKHRLSVASSWADQLSELPVLRFTETERNEYLAQRNVNTGDLSPKVLEAALHPRTAYHLTRLAADVTDLKSVTREQLMLLDFRNRTAVKGSRGVTPDQFTQIVVQMAQAARDAALSQALWTATEGEVAKHASAVALVDNNALRQVLSELVSGRWFERDPDNAAQVSFTNDALPDAVGLALATHVRKMTPAKLKAEIGAFLEPWGADDLAERMLRACAVALALDKSVDDHAMRPVLAAWLGQPFRSSAAQDVWRRLQVLRPELFLDICEEEAGRGSEWQAEWGIACLWEDHPQHRTLVEERLFRWLMSPDLPPKREAVTPYWERRENYDRRRQLHAARVLAKAGQLQRAAQLTREAGDGGDPPLIALRVLAHLPRAPFMHLLMAWAAASAIAGRALYRRELEWMLRGVADPRDGREVLAALDSAAEALGMDGATGRKAARLLLHASGDPQKVHKAGPRPFSRLPAPAGAVWMAIGGDGRLEVRTPMVTPPLLLGTTRPFLTDPHLQLSPQLDADLGAFIKAAPQEGIASWAEGTGEHLTEALRWRPADAEQRMRQLITDAAAPLRGRVLAALTFLPIITQAERFALADDIAAHLAKESEFAERPEGRMLLRSELVLRMYEQPLAAQVDLLMSERFSESWPSEYDSLLTERDMSVATALLKDVDFAAPVADIGRQLTIAAKVLRGRKDTPAAPFAHLNWQTGLCSEHQGIRSLALELCLSLGLVDEARTLAASGWKAADWKDQPTRFLGSRVLALLPDDELRPLLARLDSSGLERLYLERASLRTDVGDALEAWLRSEVLTPRSGRSFGGEFWNDPRQAEAYTLLCADRTDAMAALLEECWSSKALRRAIMWDFDDEAPWLLMRGLAPHRPELVKSIWRTLAHQGDGFRMDSLNWFPATLPAGAMYDDVRCEILEQARSDEELFSAVRALQEAHAAVLYGFVEAKIASDLPRDRALALTVGGFLDATPEAVALWNGALQAPAGPGWLTTVQQAAREWFDRGRWMRTWFERVKAANDEVEVVRAYRLFEEVIDFRHFLWWNDDEHRITQKARCRWVNFQGSMRSQRRRDASKALQGTHLHTPLSKLLPSR